MNLSQAFAAIEHATPEAAGVIKKHVEDVRKKDIVALGVNEAFALRDSTGEIRAFKQRVRLTGKDGTLVQPVPGGPYVVSHQGYIKIAEAGGAITMNAPTVLVDGQEVQNPHVYRDPDNKRILAIYCRAIAFRYSSKGIPVVSDRTTIFDVPAYRMIDLLGKAKKTPQAFKLLPNGMEPTESGSWGKYDFDESFCLWVNAAHDEALQFYAQIINREKKAMEFAQTFAQRNAIKHLFGLQAVPGQTWQEEVKVPAKGDKKAYSFVKTHCTPIDVWDVEVMCWRPTNGNIIKWDNTRYVQVQTALDSIAAGKGDAITAALPGAETGVQLIRGTDRISEETEAVAEMTDPEDRDDAPARVQRITHAEASDAEVIDVSPEEFEAAAAEAPAQAEQAAPLSPADLKDVQQTAALAEAFPIEFAEACAAVGAPQTGYSAEQARAIYREVNSSLDRQAAE